jgi:hypothetical protein
VRPTDALLVLPLEMVLWASDKPPWRYTSLMHPCVVHTRRMHPCVVHTRLMHPCVVHTRLMHVSYTHA